MVAVRIIANKPENNFGLSKGFEPMAPALALQCSTNLAIKTHTLGAGQFASSETQEQLIGSITNILSTRLTAPGSPRMANLSSSS